MITETVVRLILHCSRCNAPFPDSDGEGVSHWTADSLADAFPLKTEEEELEDVNGWLRLGDRVLCGDCTADDEELPPLPVADAAKVLRAHTGYAVAERHVVNLTATGWTIRHPLTCRPTLFDCPVNAAAERDLTDPPVGTGVFVCDVDSSGAFVVLNEVPA